MWQYHLATLDVARPAGRSYLPRETEAQSEDWRLRCAMRGGLGEQKAGRPALKIPGHKHLESVVRQYPALRSIAETPMASAARTTILYLRLACLIWLPVPPAPTEDRVAVESENGSRISSEGGRGRSLTFWRAVAVARRSVTPFGHGYALDVILVELVPVGVEREVEAPKVHELRVINFPGDGVPFLVVRHGVPAGAAL